MKRKMLMVLAGACAAALLLGALGCSNGSDQPQGVVPADQEKTIEFADGWAMYSQGDLVVELDANATTGYEWTSAIEGSAVKEDMNEYVAPGETKEGGEPVAGEGGAHMFGFKAEGSGTASIALTYARPWEASEDDKTVTIDVVVDNGLFTQVAAKES